MNHKHIITDSPSLSTDSGNEEQHASLNKGHSQPWWGRGECFSLFLTAFPFEEFSQDNWNLTRAPALTPYHWSFVSALWPIAPISPPYKAGGALHMGMGSVTHCLTDTTNLRCWLCLIQTSGFAQNQMLVWGQSLKGLFNILRWASCASRALAPWMPAPLELHGTQLQPASSCLFWNLAFKSFRLSS